jgi:hypothetical protein
MDTSVNLRGSALSATELLQLVDMETIRRLERLTAWHRINADRAGADWVWEARVRTAEDLESQAALLRHRLFATARCDQDPLGRCSST